MKNHEISQKIDEKIPNKAKLQRLKRLRAKKRKLEKKKNEAFIQRENEASIQRADETICADNVDVIDIEEAEKRPHIKKLLTAKQGELGKNNKKKKKRICTEDEEVKAAKKRLQRKQSFKKRQEELTKRKRLELELRENNAMHDIIEIHPTNLYPVSKPQVIDLTGDDDVIIIEVIENQATYSCPFMTDVSTPTELKESSFIDEELSFSIPNEQVDANRSSQSLKRLLQYQNWSIFAAEIGKAIILQGQCKIAVLLGKLSCVGYYLTSAMDTFTEFCSYSSENYLCFEPCQSDSSDINTGLFSFLDDKNLSNLRHTLVQNNSKVLFVVQSYECRLSKYLHECYEDLFPRFDSKCHNDTYAWNLVNQNNFMDCIYISNQWKCTVQEIINFREPRSVVLVCGGTNVGKSTFMRYLVNSYVNSENGIWYVEADPGQSEFTAPGCVSLTYVTKPIFTPSYMHLSSPQRCLFIGGVSMSENPDLYVSGMEELYLSLSKITRNIPVVINTMGWGKGLGINLLVDIIRIFKPTDVVQIQAGVSRDIQEFINAKFLQTASGWRYNPETYPSRPFRSHVINSAVSYNYLASKFCTARVKRDLRLIAYFGKMQNHFTKPINHFTPFKIQFQDIYVHINNNAVPNDHVINALNGSLVALCFIPVKSVSSFLMEIPSGLKILTKISVSECIGYGIVRAIDDVQQCIYVTTPLSLEKLKDVNTIMIGNMNIPDRLLLNQKCDGKIGYVMKSLSSSSVVDSLIPTKLLRKCRS